jgi:putative addiction module component (TIGR02574 family)
LRLADELYASVSEELDPELQEAWAEHIRHRVEEIRAGKIGGIPADEVFAQLRAELAAPRE